MFIFKFFSQEDNEINEFFSIEMYQNCPTFEDAKRVSEKYFDNIFGFQIFEGEYETPLTNWKPITNFIKF